MTQADTGNMWSGYRNAQLKYDSFSNKYDICTEFGLDDEGGKDDNSNEDDENLDGSPLI